MFSVPEHTVGWGTSVSVMDRQPCSGQTECPVDLWLSPNNHSQQPEKGQDQKGGGDADDVGGEIRPAGITSDPALNHLNGAAKASREKTGHEQEAAIEKDEQAYCDQKKCNRMADIIRDSGRLLYDLEGPKH